MKKMLFTLSLAVAAVSTTHAEIYRPSVVRNTTVVGAVAGALIGGHNNDRWAEGALIGAAAGALVGVAVDQSNPRGYGDPSCGVAPVREVQCAPVVSCAPEVVYVPSYSPRPRVVYVQPAPRVIVTRPVVYLSNGHRGHHRDYDRHDRRDGYDRRW